MKKAVLPVLFTFIVTMSFAQDLKKAKSYVDKDQLDKAKTEIDGFIAKSPDDAEGNYLKSKIYEKIANDTTGKFKALASGDMLGEALSAFQKAMKDTNDVKLKLMSMKDSYQPIFGLYSAYYEQAAKAFNDAAGSQSKPGFKAAMDLFIKSNNVGHYISEHKWANIGDVDTTLVLNIGKSALNAGKDYDDTALVYFSKLADAKIKGPKAGNDAGYEIPYQWLTLHYKDKGDEAKMLKYAALGKELFPKEDYFDFVLMDYYREKKNYPSLFKKYNDLLTSNPDSIRYHFNYANEIFGYLYNSDEGVVVNDKDNLLKTLKGELDKAVAIDPNDVNTNWLYSQYYYNLGIGNRDEGLKIKSTKPEDVKKKADLIAQSKTNFNTAIPYGEKAMAQLESAGKKSEKSKYKSVDNLMQNIYQSLEQKDKLKIYQDKYDAADAKFVK